MSQFVFSATAFACVLSMLSAADAQPLNRRVFASEAVYDLHVANPAFRRCDAKSDGALQPDELACYDAFPVKASFSLPAPVPPRTPIIEAAVEPTQRRSPALTATTVATDDPLTASNETHLIVRRSRNAIGSFADPAPFADAAGAEFAWADDRVGDNEVWSAHGIVAASFVHYGEVQRDAAYIDTLTLAPYINFDRTSNSTKTTEDIDNLTYGGAFEAGFANVFGATQFVDIGGALASSFGAESKNWSIDLAWQPIGGVNPEGGNTIFSYFGTPIPLGRNLVFSLSPMIQAEYVSDLSDASLQPIFFDHDEAFRMGPTVTLAVDGRKLDSVPW
ncbi:MAG TPA: hypothetical protein VMW57_08550 [Methyloceanibacter sp.]|nr:hypothetical protein [Methyloceanibacter sp.]